MQTSTPTVMSNLPVKSSSETPREYLCRISREISVINFIVVAHNLGFVLTGEWDNTFNMPGIACVLH